MRYIFDNRAIDRNSKKRVPEEPPGDYDASVMVRTINTKGQPSQNSSIYGFSK